jgi:hypothetical protein
VVTVTGKPALAGAAEPEAGGGLAAELEHAVHTTAIAVAATKAGK